MTKMTTVLERDYMRMLEVLPPAIMKKGAQGVSGFLVGEPTSHTKEGEPTYASYFTIDDWYGAGNTMTVKQFLVEIEKSEQELRDNEETPERVQQELDLYESHSKEAVLAYIDLGIEQNDGLENFEEAYAGQFDSDEDFARDMAEQTGVIKDDAQWPYTCIDWEYAARELMYDYSEQDGYYFRNI